MAQSSNSLLCQIAVAKGLDGGHAIRSNNQWLQIIAGVRTAMSANQCLQVISGRRDNANAVTHLETITATSVSSMQHGLEVWLGQLSAVAPAAPLSVTNVQKLNLSPSSPTDGTTIVAVSDGFSVAWATNPLINGFYWPAGSGDFGGTRYKNILGTVCQKDEDPNVFRFLDVNGSGPTDINESDTVDEPWQVAEWSDSALTLTHPAIQRLVAPGGGALLVSGDVSRTVQKTHAFVSADGKPSYGSDVSNPDTSSVTWNYSGALGNNRWEIWDTDVASGAVEFYSLSDTPTPLTATNWKNANDDSSASITIALTDPQGGVAVIGGTQDGVYTDNGAHNGKRFYDLLGVPADNGFSEITWVISGGAGARWVFYDGDSTEAYYSLSDVATPDLAINWKNAADDTPATIAVTSVSVGEIYAGLFVSNDGPTNGSSYVSQPFHGRQYYMGLNGGGSNNMHWDTTYNVWTDDVGAWTTSNVIFPWQGTDNGGGHTGATFSRNNVANERSWEVV